MCRPQLAFNVAWEGPDVARWRAELEDEAEDTVQAAFAAAVGGIPVDLTVDLVVADGTVGQVLVDQTGEDDVLVVGSSSRSRGGWFSVSRYCLRHADCPVVAVPAPSLGRRAKALARELRRDADDYVAIWAEPGR